MTADDHDADRILQISHSKNHGQTFGDPTLHDLPETGDFRKRIYRRRMGQAVDHVVKLEVTSPIAVTLIGVVVDMESE